MINKNNEIGKYTIFIQLFYPYYFENLNECVIFADENKTLN